MSQNKCCVPGCSVTRNQDVPLHRFPNPETDTERFKAWIINIGGDLPDLDSVTIHQNRRVCHKHFDKRHYYPNNRLCSLAIPILSTETSNESRVEPDTMTRNDTQSQVLRIPETSNESRVEPDTMTRNDTQSQVLRIPGKCTRKRLTEYTKLVKKLKKMEKDNSSLKNKLLVAKKLTKTTIFNKLSQTAQLFCNIQVTQAGKKSKGLRFSLDEKIMSLSLYKKSPRAYRFQRRMIILPSRRTLQTLLHKINLKPGINKIIFENLKRRTSRMPLEHKYCILAFDEMAIQASVSYDKTNDNITGFVDNDNDKEKTCADHVLVFMVRGIVKKYKQPLCFTYCRASTKTLELKHQIINVIKNLQNTGLEVVATVCDQGTSNVATINQLLEETKGAYLRSGRMYKGGFFEVGQKQIFPIYDPPHLIKGVRNNLLTKSLKYEMEGKARVAKWSHLQALYSRSPGYKGLKLVPKLTAQHIEPTLIPKMRVKHCTQVFSHSVGVAMGFMAEYGVLPKESTDTADLLLFFDRLFDSVNGSYSKITNGKIYRAAVITSPHHKLWRLSLPILKSMKFEGANNQGVVPSLSSWVKTIEAFELITKYLYSKGINSLLLRNLNQDALENFFGAIRSHGYSNIMPDSAAFQAAFKTLLLNNISSVHSVGANCEKDDGVCLQSIKYFLTADIDIKSKSKDIDIDHDHLLMNLLDTQTFIQDQSRTLVERSAAIGYCSGWITKLAKKKYLKDA